MRTPVITLSPIGRAYPALAIPGVGQIRGVLIDNPSGSWLLLRPSSDYVPPYTLGWARSFMGGVASVDVSYASPAGQVSTLAGDPATIVLDTEVVIDSAGSASGDSFIKQFTPNLTLSVIGTFIPGDIVSTIYTGSIATAAGKRIRLLRAMLSLYRDVGALTGPALFTPIEMFITDIGGGPSLIPIALRIAGLRVFDQVDFSGYDLNVGTQFQVAVQNLTAAFLDSSFSNGGATLEVAGTVIYQVI